MTLQAFITFLHSVDFRSYCLQEAVCIGHVHKNIVQ